MIQLRILGSPALDDGNGGHAGGLLSQPKRLALLAYLATTTNGTLARRDTVLTLFWPDQPEDKARHALNQALHVLRRTLGTETVVTRGDGIGVDHRQLWCDAAAFQEALRRGDYPGALALYRGKLLEGFFATESDGFERWLEELRRELHDRAVTAARSCAEAATGRQDGEAVPWARRTCELAPFDEEAARFLMQQLERSGDRPGALDAYGRLASRLRQDLELAPSEKTSALAESIRAAGAAVATSAADRIAPTVEVRPEPGPLPRAKSGAWTLGVGVAFLAVLTLAVTLGPRGAVSDSGPTPATAARAVAVLPFDLSRDSTGASPSAQEVAELLSARLDGAGPLRAVPVAERRTAASYVEGGMTVRAGRLHIRASWLHRDRRPIAAAAVEGEVGALFPLLDSLVIRLLGEAHSAPSQRIARVAIQSSPSLAALKAFLQGEAAFREGRFGAAARAFERAASDSTFALAQYRLGMAALWTSDYPLAAQDAGAQSLRHAAKLPNREQRLLAAFHAWRTGNTYPAEHDPRGLIAADPDDLEAWLLLGETRFHYNALLGREPQEAQAAFEQVLRLDPGHWLAHWHLALFAAQQRRLPELDRRVALLERLGPETDHRAELAALQTCAHRDTIRLPRVLDTLRTLGDGRLTDIVWRCAVYGRNLDIAETITRLLLVPGTLAYKELPGRELLASLAMARGHYRDALAQLDSLALVAPKAAMLYRTLFALIPLTPQSPDVLGRLREQWLGEPPDQWLSDAQWGSLRHRMLGYLNAALGRREEATRNAAELDRLARSTGEADLVQAQAEAIRGMLLASAGQPAEALRHYESVYLRSWFGLRVSSVVSDGLIRFQRADLLERVGRTDEAVRWYAGLETFSTFDLVYAAQAALQQGRLLERREDPAAARAAYDRFLEIWQTADPEYQPLVRDAQARRARLLSIAKGPPL